MSEFKHRSIVGIQDLTKEEICQVIQCADQMREVHKKNGCLKQLWPDKRMVNLFFENSTRTSMSFEMAAKNLGIDVINFQSAASSLAKGETIIDTAKTAEALGPDLIVIRHKSSGVANQLTQYIKKSIINAGDGMHEHPSQGLLDLYTVNQCMSTCEGLKMAIVGDVAHSRVARSNIWAFLKMGGRVTVVGPPTLIPKGIETMGVEVSYDLREGIIDKDVIIALRMQRERQHSNYLPSIKEYAKFFGISKETFAYAKPNAILLHPGPVNYGIEVAHEMIDHPRFLVNQQVNNGVYIRMALIHLVLGGELDHVVA